MDNSYISSISIKDNAKHIRYILIVSLYLIPNAMLKMTMEKRSLGEKIIPGISMG